MNLLVDTSVWSLALRRGTSPLKREVGFLFRCIDQGELVFTTGLVLQELLQGFEGPKQRGLIVKRLSLLPYIVPEREDHVEAALLRNACRRKGIQVGTIDALLAQLCIHYGLYLLTTDRDFEGVSRNSPLRLARVE